ncbi:hypothetical protein BDZ45DRAFT_735978 [Acephala macrosclerotiorum]|nr:hypothetical protein BDZ45DRAFT_735978 [Acephala macrosclerotiorum]
MLHDFATPLGGRLLRVYEGLTQHYGGVLSVRSGITSPGAYRAELARLTVTQEDDCMSRHTSKYCFSFCAGVIGNARNRMPSPTSNATQCFRFPVIESVKIRKAPSRLSTSPDSTDAAPAFVQNREISRSIGLLDEI